MQRFFTILADGVERFEGFVDKFTGDGIMALLGAPTAHEDHAQRACHAALHLRDELRRYADELRLSRGIDFAVMHECGAHLARLRGDAPAAEREIAEARRLYTAMGATARVERLTKEPSE